MIEIDPNDQIKKLNLTPKEALDFVVKILSEADPQNLVRSYGPQGLATLLDTALMAKIGSKDFQVQFVGNEKYEVTIYNSNSHGFDQ